MLGKNIEKLWKFLVPLLIVIPIGFLILRPGVFNMIPFSIHASCCRNMISETRFIIGFDVIFLLVIYLIIYRLMKKGGK
jgi:hypothetical protein